MKGVLQSRSVNVILHILIWGIVLLLPYIVSSADNDYRIGVIPGVLFTIIGLIHIVIFYSNAFYLFPKLFNRRLWWLYIISAGLLILGSFWLKYHIVTTWFPEVWQHKTAYRFVFAPSIGIFIISIVYRKVIDRFRMEQEQQEQQAAQLASELKFLRSQISPHFLFNVLTNMVSLARKKSDRLEPSLIMLSQLMRYMLYNTQDKKLTLQQEVEYLKSYIALQQLRFGTDLPITTDIAINEDDTSLAIEPMLLIPFVENAFKHGTGYVDDPYIKISLSVNNGVMLFDVQNKFDKKEKGSKDEISGIGLNNVTFRLNLLYKNKHTLNITDNDNLFHVTLMLKLV